ncbi:uncharacterized protein LOC126995571 [Eriocheir sinensis]|uniref:uncharacterized protein LOC126995571 n=1 Tax=Eriocheir sinensis TaxID=95602 RepID=UPI0021C70EF1|nr:uncharacterized protein LOC126995571 [Eriocheir sinensis]
MRRDLHSAFTTGSWHTYGLEEYSGPPTITAGIITQAMRVFYKQYKVELEMTPGPQLLFWTLTLKNLQEPPVTRSASKQKQPIKPITHVYKFAVSNDERLLFSNRMLTQKMVKQLSRSFSCDNFKLLKLKGSDPANLLIMYQQSNNRSPGFLKLQHEEYLASLVDQVHHCGMSVSRNLAEDAAAAAESKAFQTFGSCSETIPCMRQVALSVHNVPMDKDSGLPSFRWSHVDAEINAPSVFHLYRELAELKMINDVPLWLEKIRVSGKTSTEAKYV